MAVRISLPALDVARLVRRLQALVPQSVQVHFERPGHCSLLIATLPPNLLPPGVIATTVPDPPPDRLLPLPPIGAPVRRSPRPGRMSMPLRLGAATGENPCRLWFLGEDLESIPRLVADLDEVALTSLQFAIVSRPGINRNSVCLYYSDSQGVPPFIPSAAAFVRDPELPSLWLPEHRQLLPRIRADAARRALPLSSSQLTCVAADSSGLTLHSVPQSAFHDLQKHLEYQVPAMQTLTPWSPQNAFWTPVTLLPDPVEAESLAPPVSVRTPREASKIEHWIQRSLARIAERLRVLRETNKPPLLSSVRHDRGEPIEISEWHGDPSATKRFPVREQLRGLSLCTQEQRREFWVHTAWEWSQQSQYQDACLAWMHAVWEIETPPLEWLEAWLTCECQWHFPGQAVPTLLEDFARDPRAMPLRVLGCYGLWLLHPDSGSHDYRPVITRLRQRLQKPRPSLPWLFQWLLRKSIAIPDGGDLLSLARFRDLAFDRLKKRGHTCVRDLPASVALPAQPDLPADFDRLSYQRDWLKHLHFLARNWVGNHASGGHLQAYGLDTEVDATLGYVDLIFAWGASRLGDSTSRRQWKEAGCLQLRSQMRSRQERKVHGFLKRGYCRKIHDAMFAKSKGQEPYPASDLEPAGYAIARLHEQSPILQPHGMLTAFRMQEMPNYFSNDLLGKRLANLASLPPSERRRELQNLLEFLASVPRAPVLPRCVLALLLWLPELSEAQAMQLADWVPEAARTLAEWYYQSQQAHGSRSRPDLTVYLADLLVGASRLTRRTCDTSLLQSLTRFLSSPEGPPPELGARAIVQAGSPLFSCFGWCELHEETAVLLKLVLQTRIDWSPYDLLGMMAGWCLLGETSMIESLLSTTQNRLFSSTDSVPTELSIRYANGLGQLPLSRGLPLLAELLEKLPPFRDHLSTHRYYLLRPLQFLEQVVVAATSAEREWGPHLQQWREWEEWLIRRKIRQDLDAILPY